MKQIKKQGMDKTGMSIAQWIFQNANTLQVTYLIEYALKILSEKKTSKKELLRLQEKIDNLINPEDIRL